MVKKAMSKYPSNTLRENLNNVYIVKKLTFSDISAAGTNSRYSIYISNNGLDNGYTDSFLEITFHQ